MALFRRILEILTSYFSASMTCWPVVELKKSSGGQVNTESPKPPRLRRRVLHGVHNRSGGSTVPQIIQASVLATFGSDTATLTDKFLADVNSSSRSLYAIADSSVCRLSVCDVGAPYSAD